MYLFYFKSIKKTRRAPTRRVFRLYPIAEMKHFRRFFGVIPAFWAWFLTLSGVKVLYISLWANTHL